LSPYGPARSAFGCLEGDRRIRFKVGISAQQRTDLRLAEAAVAAGRPDASDAPGRGPARHGLWIHPKQAGNLSGSQEAVTVFHVVPFLGTRWSCEHSMAVDVNSTVVWSCPSWTPMRCVHAVVPLRLPLTRDCCAAFKKVGVVVTRSTRCVTKKRQPGICASFGSRVGHVVLSDVASSRRPMGPSRQRRQRSCMLGKSGLRAGVIRFTATRRDGTQDLKRKT
jgi:hypothetical protein